MNNNTRVERFSASVRPGRMVFPYARSNGDAPVPTLEDRLDAALRELASLKAINGQTLTKAERIKAAKRELATIQSNLAGLRASVDAAEARSRAATLPSRGNALAFEMYSDAFLEDRSNARDADPFARSQREASEAWRRGRAPIEAPEARSNRAEELFEDPFTRSQREASEAWRRGRAA